MVQSIRDHERFEVDEGDRVHAFLGHYLQIVERFVVHPNNADHFRSLLDAHRPLLEKLATDREEGVNIEETLPEDLGKYKSTVVRLVNDFRQEPRRLMSAVQSDMKRRGFRIWSNAPAGGHYCFLYFRNESMDETRKSLGLPWWQARWSVSFGRREVKLWLEFDLKSKEARATRPVVDRITRFMKDNPVNASPGGRAKYPWTLAGNYLIAYEHPLVTDEELIATPAAEIEDATLRKLEAFLGLDWTRIETYLKCMAFDPAVRT